METVTQKELAGRLGVSAPRINQYVQQGLPIQSDGLINLVRGLNWVRANVCGPASSRAAELLAGMTAQDDDNPVVRATNISLGCFFAYVPTIAMEAAREAGVSPEVAEMIRKIAYDKACVAGNDVLDEWLGMAPRAQWPSLETCEKMTKGL
jgi:hypothetical protein